MARLYAHSIAIAEPTNEQLFVSPSVFAQHVGAYGDDSVSLLADLLMIAEQVISDHFGFLIGQRRVTEILPAFAIADFFIASQPRPIVIPTDVTTYPLTVELLYDSVLVHNPRFRYNQANMRAKLTASAAIGALPQVTYDTTKLAGPFASRISGAVIALATKLYRNRSLLDEPIENLLKEATILLPQNNLITV